MIKIRALEEVKGNHKDIVEKEFEQLVEELKNRYNAKLEYVDEDIEEDEHLKFYTKIGEFEIDFDNFKDYINFCLKYGADIEVITPEKIKLKAEEINETLGVVINAFKSFVDKYQIGFNIYLKEKKDIDIEEFKKGKYDEEEIVEFEEDGYIRVKAVFEGIGKSEEEVIKNLITSLDREEIVVNKILTKNFDEKNFNGLIAIDLLCLPFEMFEIAYKYLPVALSVQKEEIELTLSDIQDIGNEISGAMFELSHAVVMRR
ncbi:conserved hypothetical protein [Methanocaldococcus vulcanius M7]|uniref:Uncharacterized protein n=1 Tax=Methanocaldococcus vulcanius (strain ATCC 700851 / DSM 12094 / M7) TaxID=579137 RepID=C9RHP0_METVM|nr:hypothetical protein [Methanocaldococcus vulcanius]ACX73092.1 conserved hypothetical protein [Methanocaldococcus vulcanius M7]